MPDAAFGVIVTGNIVVDTLVRPADTIVWGGTTWVDDLDQQLGGNGANTSYALGKLGVPARLLGRIGRDSFGDIAVSRLSEASVDLRWITRCAGATAASVALVAADGQRAFLHRPGVSLAAATEPIEFKPELMANMRHFHLANPFSMLGLRTYAVENLRRAKAAGLSTSLDTGWDALGEWGKILGPCLPFVDMFFVNETEAAVLEGGGLKIEAPVVVRKLGAEGCIVNDDHIPGFAADVVDTTGAGDCFAGGFLAAWIRCIGLREAARFANAVGALSVSKLGATAGLLDYETTLAWMASK